MPKIDSPRLAVAGPVFILAPPRSFTSVIGAMLGQHPQMYGTAELTLLSAETVGEWWQICSSTYPRMPDGLLRTIAQVFFGDQTEGTIDCARAWLLSRSECTTGFIIEEIAKKVSPRLLVDKSPILVYRVEFLLRAIKIFPHAFYLHLTRHPISHGESVLKAIDGCRAKLGHVPKWLSELACYSDSPGTTGTEPVLEPDPQLAWYALNLRISQFLRIVPANHQMRIKGEDLLTDSANNLQRIAKWLGLRTDPKAIEEMKHPERSVYARPGPANAPLGNDGIFLAEPSLRRDRAEQRSLDEPVRWAADGRQLAPKVKKLAEEFGYT
jgi:hypothetical protein